MADYATPAMPHLQQHHWRQLDPRVQRSASTAPVPRDTGTGRRAPWHHFKALSAEHLLMCLLVAPILAAAGVRASIAPIPARLQAQLVSKVAEYDRSQGSRSGTRLVLLVARKGDRESAALANTLLQELAAIDSIAGGPHRDELSVVSAADQVLEQVKQRQPSIVYLSSGLEDLVSDIAEGLSGSAVLTIGGVAGYAERGAVLGLESVSGRVELVVNLTQSKRQKVDFRSAFLGLARVIR